MLVLRSKAEFLNIGVGPRIAGGREFIGRVSGGFFFSSGFIRVSRGPAGLCLGFEHLAHGVPRGGRRSLERSAVDDGDVPFEHVTPFKTLLTEVTAEEAAARRRGRRGRRRSGRRRAI